jgi:hypothetical protein
MARWWNRFLIIFSRASHQPACLEIVWTGEAMISETLLLNSIPFATNLLLMSLSV